MPMYALAPTPLIRKLKGSVNNIKQVWYPDDASGAGKVNRLREWWDQIWFNTLGPKFGYFINTNKTWFVTKEDCLSNAATAFADTDVKVTSEGRGVNAGLGTEEYMQAFVTDKVQQWAGETKQLATAANLCCTHSFHSSGITSLVLCTASSVRATESISSHSLKQSMDLVQEEGASSWWLPGILKHVYGKLTSESRKCVYCKAASTFHPNRKLRMNS